MASTRSMTTLFQLPHFFVGSADPEACYERRMTEIGIYFFDYELTGAQAAEYPVRIDGNALTFTDTPVERYVVVESVSAPTEIVDEPSYFQQTMAARRSVESK